MKKRTIINHPLLCEEDRKIKGMPAKKLEKHVMKLAKQFKTFIGTKDHSCCSENGNVCGLKGKHRCCLCGKCVELIVK